MFKFTIRDLLWLMLVTALALTWWIDSHKLSTKLEHAQNRVCKCRGVAGALEHVLADDGCRVDLTFAPYSAVWIWRYDGGRRSLQIDLTSDKPSLQGD